ncbi:squalene--hopene cyclase [Lichenicola cladoniae]|uniref:Squalene--hopene cyclase n=1 Tax=Lichenicola cladoniae TaxID=1484109 RepID=A0A6M8H754_9PROT|nr:squalene--hopene cyclase [Lichenicola cladoniae]NPD66724.1 squalene--hopene cyclase [Acetobacteraceae bacterium]QKE88673.1 squalene--hopene cyclase [Lichenicola cladoniae]
MVLGTVQEREAVVFDETAEPSDTVLSRAIDRGRSALGRRQQPDGHWLFDLEADATIPAEYLLLEHYLDRIDPAVEARIGVYLRRIQGTHGGWPLYYEGRFDLSASVKAYFALKMLGDDPDAPHMVRAREAILAAGGAERSNVFTRFQLALFGEVPWHGVPCMPVEIILLPKWFFFNIWNMSYWSRTVVTPMLVLGALHPRARNPRGVRVQELFRVPPSEVRDWIRGPYRSAWGPVFKAIDSLIRPFDRRMPAAVRNHAIGVARSFIETRLNGLDGLGAIYPAMANTVMMHDALGVPADHPDAAMAWEAIRRLLVDQGDETYCQPCVSPIWDTSLAGHAMAEADMDGPPEEGVLPVPAALDAASAWLRERQVLDVKGDWAIRNPTLDPGGWAFQYNNAYYPDVDDTAVVGMLLHRHDADGNVEALVRARRWIIGMQSTNGGWGAFDIDNDTQILNHIPFSDHGALLDPPTADVTARCLSFLGQLGHIEDRPVIDRGIAYLRREQEPDGSWFGRWGTNYIYGTWSVLCALNAVGVSPADPMVVRAVNWLVSIQQPDGGWGEDCATFEGAEPGRYHASLPSQTGWALLGLMAAERRDHPAVARGIAMLTATQEADGEWQEQPYNAVGFPRVFYLRYHGYRLFFPLMALSRYRNLGRSNSSRVSHGF